MIELSAKLKAAIQNRSIEHFEAYTALFLQNRALCNICVSNNLLSIPYVTKKRVVFCII